MTARGDRVDGGSAGRTRLVGTTRLTEWAPSCGHVGAMLRERWRGGVHKTYFFHRYIDRLGKSKREKIAHEGLMHP
jgi:hypothetical protein